MALSAADVWEIRTTGNSANGGAFRAGATGTDYSRQDAAQVSYTDLVIGATTTQLTSAGNPFTSAHVGNVINIASGTGFTVGYYEVMSVAGSVATMDRSVGTAASTGGVGKLGGAADSPGTIASAVVGSNVVWIKSGTYNVDSPYFAASVTIPTPTAPRGRISGYGTVRGDSGRATLKYVGAGYSITCCLRTNTGWDVSQFDADGSDLAAYGFFVNQICSVLQCKASACKTFGINAGTSSTVQACEITGNTGTWGVSPAGINGGFYSMISGNHVHDNACTGIMTSKTNIISNNIIVNNTGASSDGIQVSNSCNVIGNTVFGNGRHGLNQTGNENFCNVVQGNIFTGNGGYGAVFASAAGNGATQLNDGNAYYLNTSGSRSNGSDTTVNPQNASGPYTNPLDKVLTGSPFVNAATKDFRLNNTAGAGAACRGMGIPTAWPGSTVVGYPDMGAAQHQDAGGGGGLIGGGRLNGGLQ